MEQGSGKSFHHSCSDRLTSADSPLGILITFERRISGAEGVSFRPTPSTSHLCRCLTQWPSQVLSPPHPCGSLSQVPVPSDPIFPGCRGHRCAGGRESTSQAGRKSVSVCDRRWLRTIRSQFFVLCLAEGCPGLCNGNGRCTLDLNGWHCVCQLGWRGAGCDTSMETACGDSKDNDGGKALAPRGPMQPQWEVGVGPQGSEWALPRPLAYQMSSQGGLQVGIKLHMWSKEWVHTSSCSVLINLNELM